MLYLSAQHLQSKLQISTDELRDFERKGILSPVTKKGITFYSSRDLYRLKGILHFVRNQGMSIDQAVERMNKAMAGTSAPS